MVSIAAQVAALQKLNVAQLRVKWKDVFGEETKQRHRQYMVRRLSWEIQRRHFGDELSDEAKARLNELQDEFRNSPPETWFKGARRNRAPSTLPPTRTRSARSPQALKPGTVLTRIYKGQQITVIVRGPREFEWEGEIYRSLSGVAKAITGSHLSGNAFFGLTGKRS